MTDAAVAQSDDRLARSAGGDHSAFAEIVREYQSMVFSLAYHFLRDRAVAEELSQEVFLALHQRLGEIQSGAHLVYWLRRVTTNRSIDQLRRQKARPQISLEEVLEPPSVGSAAQASDPILSSKLASDRCHSAGESANGCQFLDIRKISSHQKSLIFSVCR